MNNWYVISGCPSSGKTTTLNALSSQFNTESQCGEEIITSRLNLGESLSKIRRDKQLLQYQIAELQIYKEKTAKLLSIFDCSIIDCLVFCIYYKIPFPEEFRYRLTNHYKKVFILEPLKNERNGIRIENNAQRKEIQYLTHEMYKLFKIPIVIVPVGSVKSRVEFIKSKM